MSQAELGQPTYSRSYISLVESGTRAPSKDVIEHVARRLKIDIALVHSWALAAGRRGDARAAALQSEALVKFGARTMPAALKAASDLRDFALDADRLDLWWTATLMDLSIRIENDQADRVIDEAHALVDHWFTQQSPILTARVHTVLAVALRLAGRLDESIQEAETAIAHFQSSPDWRSCGLEALTALVSALGQQHRYSDALAWAPDLEAGAADAYNDLEAGKALWALANLALASGDPQDGLAYYARAIDIIDPDTSLRQWGRLHRAAADFRIKARIDLDNVPALLANAEVAFSLTSAPSDRVELDLVRGKFAALQGDGATARAILAEVLDHESLLTTSDRADAHHQMGLAMGQADDHRAAAEHLRRSVELLQEVGPR